MTNQQLAHEPLLDPFLRLDESGGHGAKNPAFPGHGIRETFRRAFWDSIEGDVKLEPPCYVRVIRARARACVCVCARARACVYERVRARLFVCMCACKSLSVCSVCVCARVCVRLRGWRAVGYGAWARVRGHDACGWRGGMSACACGHSTQPRPAADFPGPRIPGQF